jgi:hypothetical protein
MCSGTEGDGDVDEGILYTGGVAPTAQFRIPLV